jgi:mono/diheme cytochrome c family protein
MPSEADRLKDEDIWNLVNYIRSIPKNSKPLVPEKPKSDATSTAKS